jgi:hypothetical protein
MPNCGKLPLAAALLLATANLYAQSAAPPAEAKALVSAMHVAEQAREGLLAGVQKAVEQGRATQKDLDCMKSSSLGYFADAYATAFASALSSQELKDASAFFSSPEGKAYLRFSRSLELKQRGVPDSDPKTDLSEKETSAIMKFMGSSAGKKLVQERSYETTEFRSALIRGTSALQSKCRA